MRKLLKILIFTTAVLISGYTISASNYSDISNHWAKTQIARWDNYGVIIDSKKLFRPNDFITRGEMATIIDKIMNYKTKSTAKFSDLGQAFYTDPILRANKAGVINGSNGKVRPNDKITREEASVLMCKAFELNETASSNIKFADNKNISSWAAGYVNSLSNKGYITGRGGNNFDPKGNITRAEAITIVDNIVKGFYNRAQVYSNETLDSIAIVNAPNSTLKNTTIKGNLIITEGLGNGNLTLNSVKVSGDIIVKGGKINIEGSSDINRIRVLKTDSDVSIKVTDTATVKTLRAENISNDVIVTGKVETLEINSAGNKVAAVNAQLKNVSVESAGAMVAFDKDTQIEKLTIKESATKSKINIEGIATNINISASGVTFISNEKSKITTLTTTGSNSNLDIRNEVTSLNINGTGIAVTADSSSNLKNLDITGTDSNIELMGTTKIITVKGESSTVTTVKSSKTDLISVEEKALYTKLYIQGETTDIRIKAPNIEVSVEGKVSKIDVAKTAISAKIYAEMYSEITHISSQATNTQVSGTGTIGSSQLLESETKPTVPPATVRPTEKPTVPPATVKPTEKPTVPPATVKPTEKPTVPPATVKPTEKETEAISPSISETSEIFDKNVDAQADITLTFDLGSGELVAKGITSVTVAGRKLTPNSGYSISKNNLTIKKQELSELTVGNKNIVITFDDTFSTSETIVLTISDTTISEP